MSLSRKKAMYIFALLLIINTIVYRERSIQYVRAGLLSILIFYYGVNCYKNGIVLRKGSYHFTLAFLLMEAISTIIGGQNIISFLGSALVILLATFLVISCKQKSFRMLIETMCQVSLFLLYANAFVALVIPNGFSRVSNAWGWSTGI